MSEEYDIIEKENTQAAREGRVKEDDESVPEPSEEDIALRSLDREHLNDYLDIKRAVARTDLAERLVYLAVVLGLKERA